MALEAQNNPYPSILLVEGDPEALADADPAAGQRRLAVGTDHLLYLVDDAGVKHVVGGGLVDPMTTRGDMIVRNASNVSARLGRGSAGQVLTSDGTDLGWSTPATAAATLLAVTYNTAGGNKATTSATAADVDATNAVIAFTAPASGKVLVRATVVGNINAQNQNAYLGIREGTTNLVNPGGSPAGVEIVQGQTATSLDMCLAVAMYISGISAGSHTYKLSFAVNGGATLTLRAAAGGPMVLEVWAAP